MQKYNKYRYITLLIALATIIFSIIIFFIAKTKFITNIWFVSLLFSIIILIKRCFNNEKIFKECVNDCIKEANETSNYKICSSLNDKDFNKDCIIYKDKIIEGFWKITNLPNKDNINIKCINVKKEELNKTYDKDGSIKQKKVLRNKFIGIEIDIPIKKGDIEFYAMNKNIETIFHREIKETNFLLNTNKKDSICIYSKSKLNRNTMLYIKSIIDSMIKQMYLKDYCIYYKENLLYIFISDKNVLNMNILSNVSDAFIVLKIIKEESEDL